MARFRVDLNKRGVSDLLKSVGMRNTMKARADRVAAAARSAAPVQTGAYRDSIKAETHDGPSRVTGRVVAHVDYAAKVEARHRTLGRSINAARGAR